MSRYHAVNVVGIDFPAPDGEWQVPEAIGKETGVEMAIEHEYSAALVRLNGDRFEANGQTVQHSVIIHAAEHDGIAGAGQRRRVGQRQGAGVLGVSQKGPLPARPYRSEEHT